MNLTLLVNQKLLKVPLDTFEAQQTRLLTFQKFVNWVSFRAVDIDLLHDREGDTIVQLTELTNFFIGAWFLMAELVARETNNFKAL